MCEHLNFVEKQFKIIYKALAGMLMVTLITKQYNGTSQAWEHIMKMNNLVERVKVFRYA